MTTTRALTTLFLLPAFALAGCGGEGGDGAGGDALTGSVEIDGSSTVFPVSEAAAEEFQIAHPETRVTVGISGTGGGFQRFCLGDTDVSDASREIRPEEVELCEENGIDYRELTVAWDGLSVVVNPANDFVQCLTMEELRRIWEPGSSVQTWRDVRAEWPAEEIALYGAGTDSGTFDYFTEAVVGEAKASRTDYQASEDDNILVQGVAGDRSSLGYFGYAYVVENRDRLKLVAVDDGEGCVEPSDATIEDETYPLARPLYIYVSRRSLQRPAVEEFVRFYLQNAPELVPPTGYHPLDEATYQQELREIMEWSDAGDAPGTAAGEG